MTARLAITLLASALATATATAATPTGLHPIAVPAPSADGPPREVAVLADLPAVKIVAITLRDRTTLAEHSAPVPVTIEVAHGEATLTVSETATKLGRGAFVVLDANTPHSVDPADAGPVTVLVHHHKAGAR